MNTMHAYVPQNGATHTDIYYKLIEADIFIQRQIDPLILLYSDSTLSSYNVKRPYCGTNRVAGEMGES